LSFPVTGVPLPKIVQTRKNTWLNKLINVSALFTGYDCGQGA
jgi:hypothetical protein